MIWTVMAVTLVLAFQTALLIVIWEKLRNG
jgi:hypothetical protein